MVEQSAGADFNDCQEEPAPVPETTVPDDGSGEEGDDGDGESSTTT